KLKLRDLPELRPVRNLTLNLLRPTQLTLARLLVTHVQRIMTSNHDLVEVIRVRRLRAVHHRLVNDLRVSRHGAGHERTSISKHLLALDLRADLLDFGVKLVKLGQNRRAASLL